MQEQLGGDTAQGKAQPEISGWDEKQIKFNTNYCKLFSQKFGFEPPTKNSAEKSRLAQMSTKIKHFLNLI